MPPCRAALCSRARKPTRSEPRHSCAKAPRPSRSLAAAQKRPAEDLGPATERLETVFLHLRNMAVNDPDMAAKAIDAVRAKAKELNYTLGSGEDDETYMGDVEDIKALRSGHDPRE